MRVPEAIPPKSDEPHLKQGRPRRFGRLGLGHASGMWDHSGSLVPQKMPSQASCDICLDARAHGHVVVFKHSDQRPVDGRNPAPPTKPRDDDSPVNTNKQCFHLVKNVFQFSPVVFFGGNPSLVGIVVFFSRGLKSAWRSGISWFLGWCDMDFVHLQYFPGGCPSVPGASWGPQDCTIAGHPTWGKSSAIAKRNPGGPVDFVFFVCFFFGQGSPEAQPTNKGMPLLLPWPLGS